VALSGGRIRLLRADGGVEQDLLTSPRWSRPPLDE
jgi:hypothetical protein